MDFTRSGVSLGEAAVQYAKGLSCWFRDYITAIKHGRIHPFTPLERKVREATRNEPWGPTGTMLNEITEASEDHNNCSVILAVLVFRLKYPPEKWRNVYKALQVLEFILKRGSERHIEDAKIEFMDLLDGLKDFNFIGDDGRDYGINVRVRSEAVKTLLEDETLLKAERAKLQKIHNKFRGYSRDELEGNTSIEEVTRSNSWAGTTPVRSDGSGHEESASSVSSALRKSAGEMKGVSLEDNKKHIQALKKILSRPENRNCADCGEQMPTWASINCGVFVCLRCSGIHRSLGVHISKVRSCTLDTWLPAQVEFMDRTGNKVANGYWEAKLEPHLRPAGTNPMFSNFVQQKYSDKKFASGVWPPEEPVSTPVPSTNGGVTPAPIVEPVRSQTQSKLEFSVAKGDLLAFEDEAFGASTTAPVSSANKPAPERPFQFDNNALFEKRSSLVRMKSQISRDSNISPKFAGTSRSSQEVIHTTLLDFDDLESISETMSLASSKNLHSINSTNQQVSKTVNPVNHPVGGVAPVPLRPPQPPKMPPSIEAKKQVKVEPVQDLLDAPLTLSPMTGDRGLDALEDPFSFMSTVEPVAIVQSIDASEVKHKIEQLPPQTQAFIEEPQVQSSETTQAGNEMTRNSSLNIQELSRLDELFVQQVDDFLHFGYLSSVKRHNYN